MQPWSPLCSVCSAENEDVAMVMQSKDKPVVCFCGVKDGNRILKPHPPQTQNTHTHKHTHTHIQSAASCFFLPDLSGGIESHLLHTSPPSQGDTVGKATSCWPACMSMCSVYVVPCVLLCLCACECWWLVVKQHLSQGTSLGFARQKQG